MAYEHEGTALPITPELQEITEYLEVIIDRFDHIWGEEIRPQNPRFESHTASVFMMWLLMRQVESVICLARRDLILLPGALPIARTAFETGIKILWMLDPDDPYEREVRWLTYLKTEEDFHRKLGKEIGNTKHDEAESIRDFRVRIEGLLLNKYKLYKQLPNFRQILQEIGEERKYSLYIMLSQYNHSTHAATSLYRKGIGRSVEVKDITSSGDWKIPLSACYFGFASAGCRIIQRWGEDPNKLLSDDLKRKIDAAFNKVIGTDLWQLPLSSL